MTWSEATPSERVQSPVNGYVARALRRLRHERGLTLAQLARKAGIPLGSYSCLETERYRLNLESLFRLLMALDAPITAIWPRIRRGSARNTTLSAEDVRLCLLEAESRLEPLRPTLEDVLKAITDEFGVSLKELRSESRERRLTQARAVAGLLVAETAHLKLVALAAAIKRDVSSISHCIRRLREQLERDTILKKRIMGLERATTIQTKRVK